MEGKEESLQQMSLPPTKSPIIRFTTGAKASSPEIDPQNTRCCAPSGSASVLSANIYDSRIEFGEKQPTSSSSQISRDQNNLKSDSSSILHNQIDSSIVSTHSTVNSANNTTSRLEVHSNHPVMPDILPSPCAELKRFIDPFQSEFLDVLMQIVGKEHSHLQEQQKLLDLKRKERIFIGSLIRDYQVKQAEVVYKREHAQAESELLNERNTLKERLIFELNERKQRAIEDKDYLECMERNGPSGATGYDFEKSSYASGISYDYSNTTTNNGKGSAGNTGMPQRKSRRRAELEQKARRKNTMDALMRAQLPENEIMEDLFLVFGEGYTTTTSKRKSAKASAVQSASYAESGYNYLVYMKEHDISISYDGITYRKGDDVVVEKEDQDDTIGEIVNVSNNDIWIRSAADGSRFKVSIAQLRLGKTFISHIGSR